MGLILLLWVPMETFTSVACPDYARVQALIPHLFWVQVSSPQLHYNIFEGKAIL